MSASYGSTRCRAHWDHMPIVGVIRDIVGPERMVPLTLKGLEEVMRELSR
jgi:uncharacterized protein with von Willebrand factor type A (vWA) domain